MTTLVYHAGALGDFVTALPAIAAWKRTRGVAGRLVLLGKPAHAALAPGLVDEALDAGAAAFAPLFAGAATAGLRERFAGISSALAFAPEGARLVRGLAAAGIAEVVRHDPFPRGRVHVVDHHLSRFPDLALSPEERTPRIASAATTAAAVARPTERPLVLHPGSGSPTKNWPMDRFVETVAALAHRAPIAWILGPAEEETGIAARVLDAVPGSVAWRGLSLVELARRLAGARLLVGNDSGVVHLAAAAGCPVVVLFGASDPVVWAPRGTSVTVVGDGTGGMESIPVAAVLEAVRAALPAARSGDGLPAPDEPPASSASRRS
jgi:hypothetical protein